MTLCNGMKIKKTYAKSVGQIISEALRQAGTEDTFNLQQASYLWPEIVGPHISAHTSRRYIMGTELHVHIDSAPLKNELQYLTDSILKRLNQAVGTDAITRIIIH